jgi:hypothetical protein
MIFFEDGDSDARLGKQHRSCQTTWSGPDYGDALSAFRSHILSLFCFMRDAASIKSARSDKAKNNLFYRTEFSALFAHHFVASEE